MEDTITTKSNNMMVNQHPSLGGGSGYGSIHIDNGNADHGYEPFEQRQPFTNNRKTVATACVALLAFLAVMVHFHSNNAHQRQPYYYNKKNDVATSMIQEDVDMLGAVYRSHEDTARWFTQYVDHLDDGNKDRYSHRYYAKEKYFKGPGHPIILIVGGEEGNDDGFFYPFVDEHLAQEWGALVLFPEHRFYGQSQPVDPYLLTFPELAHLLELHQAMMDMLAIVKTYKRLNGCSDDKTSRDYCPVISVGGSYPGFVSALFRLHYPNDVDIAYASSAPLKLYADAADQFGYMDIVTRTADLAAPGCAAAVKHTLAQVDQAIRESTDFRDMAHRHLNICEGTVPKRIATSDVMANELMMVVEQRFANANMGQYPPDDPDNDMNLLCEDVFLNDKLDTFGKMTKFWTFLEDNIDITLQCFDMSSQLPSGPNPAISGADWSGIGAGYDGMIFDFHCCATLTPNVGFGPHSMFPYREWSLEWLNAHCMDRFGIMPDKDKLLREYKFDDLVGQNATRILFVNGMNDLWSHGSYMESLSDSILAINIPDGAHHTDLNKYSRGDPKPLQKAQRKIEKVLSGWLKEIKKDMVN